MNSVDPGAGNVEEVEHDIFTMSLGGKDYIWDGGTVDQELAKGW